jgi:hypothetical protein
MIIFHQDTTDICVKKVLEDPYKFVRDEEICYFMRNMVYLFFVCMLLFAACNGNMHFEKKAKTKVVSFIKPIKGSDPHDSLGMLY